MFPPFDQRAAFRGVPVGAPPLAKPGSLAVDERVPPLIGQGTSPGSLFARQKVVVVGQGSVGASLRGAPGSAGCEYALADRPRPVR